MKSLIMTQDVLLVEPAKRKRGRPKLIKNQFVVTVKKARLTEK